MTLSSLERANTVYAARGLGISEKAVLLCLAHHDGPEGARISVATLAAEVGAGERTVQGALRELEVAGLIRRESRGHNLPPFYRLQYETIRAYTPAESAPPQNLHPPQNLPPSPAESAPYPPQNLHPNEKNNKKLNEKNTPPTPKRGRGPKAPEVCVSPPEGVQLGLRVRPADLPAGAAEVWRVWAAESGPFPRAELTRDRLGALRDRLAEHGPERLIALGQWLSEGQHDRARFVRDRGDPLTPLRRGNCETYLGFMAQPQRVGGGARASPAPTRGERALAAMQRASVTTIEAEFTCLPSQKSLTP